ncbi:hypothetical protein [Calothrix sp. NIES-2098]|uniref:hypothetical protein n=1 Tax=Calothrix sp. NIES-2098 TaxID=1954171 RepID=UPI000BBBE2C0
MAVIALLAIPETARAASRLLLELGDKGMAKATLTLEPQTGNQAGVLVRILALPFELDSKHRISNPDNVAVSVLSNSNGYALLSLLAPQSKQPIDIKIDNAFNLIGGKIKDRVILKCEVSYQFLRQHRSVLDLAPTTISSYDITILLPNKYDQAQLSFQPMGDWKADEQGRKYTLPASVFKSSASPNEVFIAFPSPFENDQQWKIIISFLIGIVLLTLGNFTVKREIGEIRLGLIIAVAIILWLIFAYFLYTAPKPMDLIEWAIAPMIPMAVAPFWGIWLLYAIKNQGEIQGKITLDSQPAPYLRADLIINGVPKKLKVNDDGTYKDWVWCGNKTIDFQIRADADGVQGTVSSSQHSLNAKDEERVETLNLQSLPLPPSSPSSGVTPTPSP